MAKCLICGRKAECLHHYISRGASAKLIKEPENLIPLCNECHRKLHQDIKFNGKKMIEEIKGVEWIKKINKLRYGDDAK